MTFVEYKGQEKPCEKAAPAVSTQHDKTRGVGNDENILLDISSKVKATLLFAVMFSSVEFNISYAVNTYVQV